MIDADGKQLGVFITTKAIELAENQGLDLVEISPNAVPPVCKIMDYGKYKYELTKKQKEEAKARLRSRETDLVIGTHALIEDDVRFSNLGLVVVDEQHRF